MLYYKPMIDAITYRSCGYRVISRMDPGVRNKLKSRPVKRSADAMDHGTFS